MMKQTGDNSKGLRGNMASKAKRTSGTRKTAGTRKTTGTRKTAGGKRPSAKRTSGARKNTSASRRSSSYRSADPVMNTEILCWCLLGASILMFICVIGFGGGIGNSFGDLLFCKR